METQRWEWFRDYCNNKGWTIEPIPDHYEPEWLEISGQVYELKWKSGTLQRVTLHEDGEAKDLEWDELPEELKGLL